MADLDKIDLKIFQMLRQDSRIPMPDLATSVGLSPTPCGRCVRRMEQPGIIQGDAAIINRAAPGRAIGELIAVRLARHSPEGPQQFLTAVARHPEITACLLVTGNSDDMLRVHPRDIDAQAVFIRDVLQAMPRPSRRRPCRFPAITKSAVAPEAPPHGPLVKLWVLW